jgi:zinc transporter ZupT
MFLLNSIVAILTLLFDRDYFSKNKRRIFWYAFYNSVNAYICLWYGYEVYKDPEKAAQLGWIFVVVIAALLYISYKSGFSLVPLPKDLEKS